MEDERDTLWVKVYDGEGDDAKLIFEGTARQWEIFRTTHDWDAPKGTPPGTVKLCSDESRLGLA